MSSRRGGLGRGLESLIPGLADDAIAGAQSTADIDSLEPNPLQPRSRWDESALEELAESIRAHGIIQPIVVTRNGEARPYQIIAGERRWRAAQRAGLSSVPILVREATPAQALELALIENIQRADLNPVEEALAYRHLIDEFGLTQARIAERIGRGRPSIANSLRILAAPDDIREAVANEEITAGHAKALLSIPDREAQEAALRKVLDSGMSVRDAERLAQALTREPGERTRITRVDAGSRSLEHELSRAYGTKVEVHRTRRGGRIVVHFFSDEELSEIGTRMLGQDDDL